MNIWVILADLAILGICVFGDRLLEEPDFTRIGWMRAIIDNSTHGAVGLLSWMVVLGGGCNSHGAQQIFLCGILASLVDIDHFIAAKSIHLKDVLSLPSRPPFHNTTLLFVIFIVLLLLQRNGHILTLLPGSLGSVAWIFLVAWLSHHLRDANRRGLWFWPIGSTPPLPRSVYLGSVMMLPVIVKLILSTLPNAPGFKTEHLPLDNV